MKPGGQSMKKRISVLLVLLCLIVNTVCVRPIVADDEADQHETSVEILPAEEETLTEETEEETGYPQGEVSETEDEIPSSEETAEPETDATENKEEVQTGSFEFPSDKAEMDITSEGFSFAVPENFKFRKIDLEGKKRLKEEKVYESFSEMVEGEDYKAKELLFLSDSLEYAKQVAEIYHCELKSYEDGVALIEVEDDKISVDDIFSASLNEEEELPLVEPNYVVRLNSEAMMNMERYDPRPGEDGTLPAVNDWNGWINDTFEDPDPFLMYPAEELHWHHEMIETYTGWNATMGDPEVKVAIIGEGVNPDHEELVGRVQIEEVNDVEHCYGDGSGTILAGIIAAEADNGVGGAGVAPNVGLISINIFEKSGDDEYYTSSYESLIKAIQRAVQLKAHVIDIYWYDWTYNEQLNRTIQNAYYQGAVIVAQAGDDGSNIKCFPGAYDHVICVADITRDGTKHYLANYGSWVTVGAPGPSLVSAFSSDEEPYNDGYSYCGGSSISAAVVSGSLALYMSKAGRIDYDQAVALLKSSSTKTSSKQVGYGVVNVANMFKKVSITPMVKVYNASDDPTDPSKPVPEGSYFTIESTNAGERDVILYTTDGKKPSIKDGKIVNGIVYKEGDQISLDQFEKGKTITVNAAIVNGFGVLGKVTKTSIKTTAVKVEPVKIKTVTLGTVKATLSHSSENPGYLSLTPSSLINVNGEEVSLDDVSEYIWISSNKKVAEVDEYGNVYTAGAGTAKITLKILDGSNKSAVCTVTVIQLPESVEVTGQDAMAPGTSASFKASVFPSNTKNKKVEWKIEASDPSIVVSGSGKVTVPKDVYAGESFIIYAYSLESGEIYGEKYVEICPKASKVTLLTEDSRAVYSKTGALSSVNIFTIDINDDLHPDTDNQVQLEYLISENDIPPVWSSSNTKVATVDENGVVTGLKAGTTKITCSANDGSKKKATVTVKVTVPISSLNIAMGNSYALSIGKSINLNKKLSYGVAYGKPSLKKVNWTIEQITYNSYGEEQDITDVFLSKGFVKIDKSGKLTVKKSKEVETFLSGLSIYLRADSADGTNYSTEAYVWVTGTFTGLTMEDQYGDGMAAVAGGSDDDSDCYKNWVYTEWDIPLEIVSSNPDIVGAYIDTNSRVELTSDPSNPYDYAFYITKNGKTTYYLHGYQYDIKIYTYPGKKGTAYLTVKAADGSGLKSFKLKVVVR